LLALACCTLAAAQDLATVTDLLEAGRLEEAWNALQQAPAAETVDGHLLASRILEERSDLPGAAAQAEAALAADPFHQPARLQLGRLFLTGNNPEAALDVFVEGLQRAPDNTMLRLGEALALNQLRRYEQALDRFKSVLGSAPGLAVALDGFVEAALELQLFDEARQVVSNGLKAAPNDHRGYYRLALIGDRSGSSSAAETERLLRKSIEGHPLFAPAYSLLGKALLQLERPEEAALMLETALRLTPGDRLGRIQLARAYRVLGRTEDAKREAETVRQMQDARPADSGVLRRRAGDSPTAAPPR
jgi:tetratricopeptide (TPR) repeat protein